jgi:hypothetical protein
MSTTPIIFRSGASGKFCVPPRKLLFALQRACPIAGLMQPRPIESVLRRQEERNSRSLHFATPDFLWTLVALADLMRLSLRERRTRGFVQCCVAGKPGTLRFAQSSCTQRKQGEMQKFSATVRQGNGKGTPSVQSVFSVFVWVSVTKAMPFAFSFCWG